MKSRRRTVFFLILAVYILFILDLTLHRFPSRNPPPNFVPFRSMIADWTGEWRGFIINFVGNIVAFMPIGLIPPLLRTRNTKARDVVVFCFCLSAAIEIGQYASARRVADVDDVILNTIGGVLGYSILRWVQFRAADRNR
jgi:glycopeptide antibiotics resistance protein